MRSSIQRFYCAFNVAAAPTADTTSATTSATGAGPTPSPPTSNLTIRTPRLLIGTYGAANPLWLAVAARKEPEPVDTSDAVDSFIANRDRPTANALDAAISAGQLPVRSLALYARWWQLETWLRELVYLELRAKFGIRWFDAAKVGTARQQADLAFTHMAGVDGDNILAYLDYSQLVDLVDKHWTLFEKTLLNDRAWSGRHAELRQIRHRIGHVRRPHADDLNRLEQTLRDLESGAFTALASYNDRMYPDISDRQDPVSKGWISLQHETAQRLVQHAWTNYETNILVRCSRRPWASWPNSLREASGILWHVGFTMRGRSVDVRRLWRDLDRGIVKAFMVHMLVDDPHHVEFTFSAVDDGDTISDPIGAAFDAVLTTSRTQEFGIEEYETEVDLWQKQAQGLDYRILVNSPWGLVDDRTVPIPIFGAGGGVSIPTTW